MPVDVWDDLAADTPGDGVKRNGRGQPLIWRPGQDAATAKPTPYTRCTTFVDNLDDKTTLSRWSQRMVLEGVALRPHLLLSAQAAAGDRRSLDEIAEQAKEAAGAGDKAAIGTAVHALCERADRAVMAGATPAAAYESLGTVVEPYGADVRAYLKTTAHMFRPVAVEQFTVCDEYGIAGTPDRVAEYIGPGVVSGDLLITDIKTGSVEYGVLKMCRQLAVYAHSVPYDQARNVRGEWPAPINDTLGVIIHLPAGTGTCQLIWVDLQRGWAGVDLAAKVREYNRRPNDARTYFPEPSPVELIVAAWTVDEVRRVWADHKEAWTPEMQAAAASRVAEIRGTVAA